MQKSDDISLLAAALAKAMPKVKTALMDSVNPFFKSKYADLGAVLDAVKEALEANNLCAPQFPDHLGQEPALTTMLIHESGQWMSGTYPLMVTDKEHTPQGYGSALTYARRYGLSAVLGVIADTDDDGNAASKPAKPTVAKAPVATEAYAPTKASVTDDSYAIMCETKISNIKTPDDAKKFRAANYAGLSKLDASSPELFERVMKALIAKETSLT